MPDGWINRHIPQAHCEEANDSWGYERKEHAFWSSEDSTDVLKLRYGSPTDLQKLILKIVRSQNDRQIDVFMDPTIKGGHGKSWLSAYLFEHGQAMVVPRSNTTPERMSAYICSAYDGEDYIIIDIPRAGKIKKEMYESLEEIKDGLVYDHRYHGVCRNIRGAKLIIFTNQKLDLKQLSSDRWRLHGITQQSLEHDLHSMNLSKKTQIYDRQTNVDKTEDTGLNRSTKEEEKCTEEGDSTDAGTTDVGTDTAGAGGESP